MQDSESSTNATESASASISSISNIYFETLIDKKVVVEPRYLTANNNDYILGKLKKRYEGKCLKEGHIKEDSIEIVVKGVGILEGSHFTGDITYNIRFRALVCKPVIGDLLEFEVKVINQVGPRGILGPIQITVPREIHDEMEIKALSSVKVGSMIRVRVITTHFTPNSTNIRVVAKLDVPSSKGSGTGSKRSAKRSGAGATSEFVTSDHLDDDEEGDAMIEGMNDADEDEDEDEEKGDADDEEEEDIELSDSEDEAGEEGGEEGGEEDGDASKKKASFNIDKKTGEEEEGSEIDLEEEFEDSGNESDQSDRD
jgi:DNA-directed RNA polymerase subunit E'/Rpb7